MPSAPDEILAATRRIERILANYEPGCDNKQARDETDKELSYIKERLSFGGDKISSIRDLTATLYSPAKAQRRYGPDGIRKVKHFIRLDCASIEAMAEQIRTAGVRRGNGNL